MRLPLLVTAVIMIILATTAAAGTREPERLSGLAPRGCWGDESRLIVAESSEPQQLTTVPDGAGGAYVTWMRRSDHKTFLVRTDREGQVVPPWPAAGLEIGTGHPVTYVDDLPAAVADGTGGVYVMVEAGARHFLGDGTVAPGWPAAGLPVVGPTDSPGAFLPDGAGGLLVVAVTNGAATSALKVRRYDATGTTPAPWPVGGRVVKIWDPNVVGFVGLTGVAGDGAGGVFVAWDYENTTGDGYAYVRDGLVQWSQAISTSQARPQLVPAGAGNALGMYKTNGVVRLAMWSPSGATWDLPSPLSANALLPAASDGASGVLFLGYTGTDYRLFRRDATGATPPGWPSSGVTVSPLQTVRILVVPDLAGGALVFAYRKTQPGQAWDLDLQSYSGSGTVSPSWPVEGIRLHRTYGTFPQQPWVLSDGEGGYLVHWIELFDFVGTATSSVLGQRLCPDAPVPVALAFAGSEYDAGVLRLRWHAAVGSGGSANVERREDDAPLWEHAGEASLTLDGDYAFDDATVRAGQALEYRLTVNERGQTIVSESVRIEIPVGEPALALAPGRQPMHSGDLVRFSLGGSAAARLELFDAGGRRRWTETIEGFSPGEHELPLSRAGLLTPGVYWLRLTQGTESRKTRFVLLD